MMKSSNRFWMLSGILLGALLTLSPGGVFVSLVAAATAGLLAFSFREKDKRFVVLLFSFGFLLRAGLSLGLDLGSYFVEGQLPMRYSDPQVWDLGISDRTREYIKMGDSDYLSQRGYALAQFASGNRQPVVVYRAQEEYGWNGYAYLVAAFYQLFGYSPSTVKWINCYLGALIPVLMFLLARITFNGTVARWASCAIVLWPSLVLWSASNLKEPSLTFLTALMLVLFLKMSGPTRLRNRLMFAGTFFLVAAAHASLRSGVYTAALIGAVFFAWFFISLRKPLWRWTVLGGMLLALLWVQPDYRPFFSQAIHLHIGHHTTPGITYHYLPPDHYVPGFFATPTPYERITPSFTAQTTLRAVAHYLVEPLPKRLDSLYALAWYPMMVIWYICIPFLLAGVCFSLLWNFKRTSFLLLFLGLWIFLGAMTAGNPGTVLRMRDMLIPFFLVLTCAGLWGIFFTPRKLAIEEPIS